MYIIVYYKYTMDSAMDARELAEMLAERFGKENVKLKNHRLTIDIFDVRIDFRSGELDGMAGVCPDYFIAYNFEAVQYLQSRAARVNGKRLGKLEDIVKVIYEYYNNIEEVPSNENPRQ